MTLTREKIVLAYSGGLDTSCILVWLIEKGYDVIAYLANIGQEEDFEAAKKKAQQLGAIKVIVGDVRERFLKEYIYPLLKSGALYEGRYMLGTAIARPCIAEEMIAIAQREKATAISHGATGKGNDQVRFELACYALLSDIRIVAPWKIPEFYQRFPGRPELFEYAASKGVPLPATLTPKTPWSVDSNLMHNSYESGILEDPSCEAPADLFQSTADPFTTTTPEDEVSNEGKASIESEAVDGKKLRLDDAYTNGNVAGSYISSTPAHPQDIEISFKAGEPVGLDIYRPTTIPNVAPAFTKSIFEKKDFLSPHGDLKMHPHQGWHDSYKRGKVILSIGNDPLAIFMKLNQIAGQHGIGRLDIVEDRFVGMKSRGIYETPGYTVLFEALRDLETLVLDREVLRLKRYLSERFSEQIYNGFWFSPECEYTRGCLKLSGDASLTGTVKLRLFKGKAYILARKPAPQYNLYDKELVSMDVKGDYEPTDASGFIKINSLRLKAHHKRKLRIDNS